MNGERHPKTDGYKNLDDLDWYVLCARRLISVHVIILGTSLPFPLKDP